MCVVVVGSDGEAYHRRTSFRIIACVCVCLCVFECVCERACGCMRACLCVCVCECICLYWCIYAYQDGPQCQAGHESASFEGD